MMQHLRRLQIKQHIQQTQHWLTMSLDDLKEAKTLSSVAALMVASVMLYRAGKYCNLLVDECDKTAEQPKP